MSFTKKCPTCHRVVSIILVGNVWYFKAHKNKVKDWCLGNKVVPLDDGWPKEK